METGAKNNNNRIFFFFGNVSLHDCPELFPTIQSLQASANGTSWRGGRGGGFEPRRHFVETSRARRGQRRQRGSPTVNTESATEMISSLNAENTPRISVCSPYCSFSLLNPNLTSAAE